VSSRHTRSFFGVLLVVVFALSAVIVAPASAKLSKSQKVHIRHQLRKQIKKHPKLIRSKHFIKRAALVDFKLPVTLRLRGSNAATNPNSANVDLGASLGQREVDLGGSRAAEIVFHDRFVGGALGNVDINILPSNTKNLTSTSIPLLWNTQVSSGSTRWDANLLGLPSSLSGCGNFAGTSPLPFGSGLATSGSVGGIPQPGGLPGVPYIDPAFSVSTPAGALPVKPGTDDINNVVASKIPGNDDNVGGNVTPFPYTAQSTPGGFTQPPSTKDTVLRTNALKLNFAGAGTEVNNNTTNGVSGSQNIVIGKSGGQANLFGNIPGKSNGIDVTVSLATKINSIFRIVDQDSFQSPLITGAEYPAGIFGCRQIWSGAVQNYIPDVRLTGNLKIAPGITSDGHLRIAKATVSSESGFDTHFAVSACLAPYSSYAHDTTNGTNTDPKLLIPASVGGPTTLVPDSSLPGDPLVAHDPAPSAANCNDTPTPIVNQSALNPASVGSLSPAAPANGYTVTNSGSAVTVGADLHVTNVSIDVLIGDV
jgi:hypothetical protein